MDIEFIKELSNLGGMFLALCASAYFVKYTSDSHKSERQLLYQKTHAEYMQSMQQLNTTLSTMSTAITELRSEIKLQNERSR